MEDRPEQPPETIELDGQKYRLMGVKDGQAFYEPMPWMAKATVPVAEILAMRDRHARLATPVFSPKSDHFSMLTAAWALGCIVGSHPATPPKPRPTLSPKPELLFPVRMKGGKRIDPRKARAKRP